MSISREQIEKILIEHDVHVSGWNPFGKLVDDLLNEIEEELTNDPNERLWGLADTVREATRTITVRSNSNLWGVKQ